MIRELNINNYETYFVLGNDLCEKHEKRKVILNISIRFLDSIVACENDQLSSSVCYASLLNFIDQKLIDSNFNLIEKAAQYVYDSVTEFVSCDVRIIKRVEVIKPNPGACALTPLRLESSSFVLSDW